LTINASSQSRNFNCFSKTYALLRTFATSLISSSVDRNSEAYVQDKSTVEENLSRLMFLLEIIIKLSLNCHLVIYLLPLN